MKLSILAALPENKINDFLEKLTSNFIDSDFANFNYFPFPVIKLQPIKTAFEEFGFQEINEFDYLLFTSSYGASIFFDQLKEQAIRLNQKTQLVSVGPSVSKVIKSNKYKVALTADIFSADGLADKLRKTIQFSAKRFLLITGQKSNSQILEQTITQESGAYEKLVLYSSNTVVSPCWENLAAFIDCTQNPNYHSFICLSSPEGAKAFSELLNSHEDFVGIQNFEIEFIAQNIKFICLGPATKDLVKNLFPNNEVLIGSEYSYRGIINSIKSTIGMNH
jgi:uroporphyrinogen-III synthase